MQHREERSAVLVCTPLLCRVHAFAAELSVLTSPTQQPLEEHALVHVFGLWQHRLQYMLGKHHPGHYQEIKQEIH